MKEYVKSKAPLALMEQIVMILVFAFAAAICIEAFVYSNNMSKEGEAIQMAQKNCQTVTEHIKAAHGDWEKVCEKLSGAKVKDGYQFIFEQNLKVIATETEGSEYTGEAVLNAYDEAGKNVYTMNVVWQKGGKNG